MGYYIINHDPEEEKIKKWKLYPFLKVVVHKFMDNTDKELSDEALLVKYVQVQGKSFEYASDLTASQISATVKAIRLALKELYP